VAHALESGTVWVNY
jgi:hypothetical protein